MKYLQTKGFYTEKMDPSSSLEWQEPETELSGAKYEG